MPNSYFVYTIVFSRTPQNATRFIGFQKRAKGYFFSGKGGAIVPNGQPLKGAEKFALPGGGFEGADNTWDDNDAVFAQCQKEFTEECGRQISFVTHDDVVSGVVEDDDEVINAVAYLQRWGVNMGRIKGYAAMYIQVADNQLQLVADYIGVCFNQRDQAVQKITKQEWGAGDYAKIAQIFPLAPMDDEVNLVDPPIRQIAQGGFNNDPLIEALSKDPDTDWFAQIIKGLETIGA
ncbi:hypothetical protein [Rhizobium sp. P44RR-XXIV]|uniref:hypothetical protein n=1 Tax=Rhizobium sp. P44RR-XXIV TaxID=1921145 RepID=UPI0009854A47|nr:hypothetical protein [Rhizobium sp. P44RR-XXIV]TIX90337.1 hypothetical protein BSK43_013670 [Rhizobium sp. P44RR-XXIV]